MAMFRSNPSEGGRLWCLGPVIQQQRRMRQLRTGEELMWENERGRERAAFKGGVRSQLGGGGRGTRGGLTPNNEKRSGYGSRQ
jgi:hypothetical protein